MNLEFIKISVEDDEIWEMPLDLLYSDKFKVYILNEYRIWENKLVYDFVTISKVSKKFVNHEIILPRDNWINEKEASFYMLESKNYFGYVIISKKPFKENKVESAN